MEALSDTVVDEGIIPFKGHVKWRQHVKSKPHSTGVKYYAVADDAGYVYDFFLFAEFCTRAEKAAGIPNPRSQAPQQVVHQFWIVFAMKRNRAVFLLQIHIMVVWIWLMSCTSRSHDLSWPAHLHSHHFCWKEGRHAEFTVQA